MRIIHTENPGPESRLVFRDRPLPACGAGALRVRVQATALNRADLLQRAGHYPPPEGASPVLGLEMAGVVETVGDDVDGWAVGDRVCALLPGGGYAEYAVIPAAMAMRIPDSLGFEEAAALPEVFLTAFQALCWLARLQASETALIHAGASGVGTAAIQLAGVLGARAIVTASAPKHAACLRLGAAAAIDYRTDAFDEAVMTHTDGHGADVVLDVIGAPYLAQNVVAAAVDARIVLLALMGGSRVEMLDLRPLFRKRIHLLSSTLRARSPAYKAELTRDFVQRMGPHVASGTLAPVIDRVYDWADAEDAHARMRANANTGKLVLRVT